MFGGKVGNPMRLGSEHRIGKNDEALGPVLHEGLEASAQVVRLTHVHPHELKAERQRRALRILADACSITQIRWSALSSSDGGIVRPSVLAVLRLTTSSNREACRMGRLPGSAPLRILSTSAMDWRKISGKSTA